MKVKPKAGNAKKKKKKKKKRKIAIILAMIKFLLSY